MTTGGSTYRRTRGYQLVYCKLLGAARDGRRVSYAEVSDILGSLAADPDMISDANQLLEEMSEDEHEAGRPMLTALVVTGKSIPGDVFFSVARRLGRLASADPAEEMKFWMAEERSVYDTWKPRIRD